MARLICQLELHGTIARDTRGQRWRLAEGDICLLVLSRLIGSDEAGVNFSLVVPGGLLWKLLDVMGGEGLNCVLQGVEQVINDNQLQLPVSNHVPRFLLNAASWRPQDEARNWALQMRI